MTAIDSPKMFDAYYFAHGCGQPYQRDEEWLRFFDSIADRIIADIRPGTILDAGCALGFLVESLRARGVDAFGLDISEYAIQNVSPSIQPYCRVGSVTEPFSRQYDLIVSIEVLEHMPKADSEQAIVNFCQHTDDILFSSTPLDYKEATHFNVQPPEYWAEQFARHGFVRDVDFDASFLTPWAVRFRRSSEPLHRIIRDYERRFGLLLKENQDLRSLSIEARDQLSVKENAAASLQTQIEEKQKLLDRITASRSWKLINWVQRMRRRLSK